MCWKKTNIFQRGKKPTQLIQLQTFQPHKSTLLNKHPQTRPANSAADGDCPGQVVVSQGCASTFAWGPPIRYICGWGHGFRKLCLYPVKKHIFQPFSNHFPTIFQPFSNRFPTIFQWLFQWNFQLFRSCWRPCASACATMASCWRSDAQTKTIFGDFQWLIPHKWFKYWFG